MTSCVCNRVEPWTLIGGLPVGSGFVCVAADWRQVGRKLCVNSVAANYKVLWLIKNVFFNMFF